LKRIALLSNYPADHATFTGGVETATAALVEGLRACRAEFEFHVVSVSGLAQRDVREEREGVWFHFLSLPRYPWLRPRLVFRVVKARRELRRIGPDLVHCHDNMALALAAIAGGYPRVFTVHGVKRHEAPWRTGWQSWSAHLDALMEAYVHRHFDAFICVSSYVARVVGDQRLTFAIPNPVRSRFLELPARAAPLGGPRLLFVGVLAPLKRPADLLLAHAELWRQHPGLETVFCGEVQDAGYAQAMRQMVIGRRIEGAHFLGRVSQERLAELLAGATALVLPSAQENAPMVIAEAMAAGVPVVATRVGGVPDMVRDGETGLLFEPGSVAELTDCLRRLLADGPLQERLGQQARKVAQATYAPARVALATVEVYRRLLGQQSATALGRRYA